MPTAKTQIKFKYGLQENYTKLTAKDANTLYFATDTQRLFVGDVEYTRPVITGTSTPTMDSPLNTLFYNTSTKTLYTNTADGWLTVATNFSLSTTGVTAGTYGDTTAQTPTHGTTFKVPSFTVDTFGRLTDAKEHTVKLPAETQLSKGTATTGTATKLKHGDEFTVETDISVSGHAVTPEKTTFTLPTETTLSKGTATTGTAQAPAHGKSFTVITDVNVSGHTVTPEKTTITLPAETAETPVSIGTSKTDTATATHGGKIKAITALTASGHVVTPTVTTITLPSVGKAAEKDVDTTISASSTNLPTSKAVNDAISTAISGVTQFDIQVVTELPATGTKGVIYLKADAHSDDNDSYDEYIWNTAIETPAFEKIGNTDVNLSGYIEKVKSAEGYVPKFNTDGALVSTGYTLGKSVPASAVFTDTKVTAVANHYTPTGGTTASASGGTVTDIANDTGVQVVTGVTKDAAGHVTGITSVGLKSTNTDTKVNMKARGTTKAYLLGTSIAPTASNQAVESLAETGVYLDTTAGTLVATTFEGALSGNATSATKATQDGEGHTITTTYATKTEVTNATLVWESF